MKSSSLPMGLNRISWKPDTADADEEFEALPMGLNRISWKHFVDLPLCPQEATESLPMGLIGLVGNGTECARA